MSLTAPYSQAMRLGQGFNSYTQECRIEGAVKIDQPDPAPVVTKSGSDGSAAQSKDAPIARPDGNAINPNAMQHAPDFANRAVAGEANASALVGQTPEILPFSIPSGPCTESQSVSYATRAIENLSEVMDALNISAATSIKYGTIKANAGASFVNEGKVLESQLNYVVSVKVSNTGRLDPEGMQFQPIEDLPPDRFTEVYGDCFISGFQEGGEFNAIISIEVHDKSKLSKIKQSVDVQLAVGPAPVTIGASESVDKDHRELFEGTEITISVNWSGGGEIKKPEVPWTLTNVVAVANAFPSMVARSSAVTSAILTPYTSLNSFQAWRWRKANGNPDSPWASPNIILNYAPCALYTTELFDAMMGYKKIWKHIGLILSDTSKWRTREAPKQIEESKSAALRRATASRQTPIIREPPKHALSGVEEPEKSEKASNKTAESLHGLYPEYDSPLSPEMAKKRPVIETTISKSETFHVADEYILEGWSLDYMNRNRSPISLDPYELNEARLACREAMTLITQEASRLVNHPDLAYADYNPLTKKTRMKKPIYAYPEVLKNRLPVFVRNDASDDAFAHDAAAALTKSYAKQNDLFCQIIGDHLDPDRKYKPFTSLALSEGEEDNDLTALSLHGYHHHSWAPSSFSKASDGSIAAIGFRFLHDEGAGLKRKDDGCTNHYGSPFQDDDVDAFKSLELPKTDVDIVRIDVSYVPGSGRIAGIVFFDDFGGHAETQRLAWRQWKEGRGEKKPEGMVTVSQYPPTPGPGERWRFVGIAGDWDTSMWGHVLARVSGVWRKH